MERPRERAIACGDGGEKIGARGRDDTRGECRCVHAVIADGDEIGVQPFRFGGGGRNAAQHAQRIGRVAARGIGRDWRFAVCLTYQRGGDHRQRADDRRVVGETMFAVERRRRRAKAVHHRQTISRGEQSRQALERAHPRFAQGRAHFGFADQRRGGERPQPRCYAFEAVGGGQIADPFTGDDEFALFAIDMAEAGFGGGDPIEADGGFRGLQGHVQLLCCVAAKVVVLDLLINLD